MQEKVRVVRGDITQSEDEAIVNAANNSLLGGGGVDGAIHRAAGPGLLQECRALGGCATGDAKITGGYNLKARWVIHTVGPVWHGGGHGEEVLLARCYRRSLEVACEHDIESISFPSISTGVYGYPLEPAANIAVREVLAFLAEHERPDWVTFVAFGDEAFAVYSRLLSSEFTRWGNISGKKPD